MFIKGHHKFTPKLQWIFWNCLESLLLIMVITQGKTVSGQQYQHSGFECNEEGYHEDPRSCSIYYRCVNWGNGSPLTKFKFECGPGTVFSHAKGDICVHPRESERSECSESVNDLGNSDGYNPSTSGETGPPAVYPDYPSYGSPLPGTSSSGLSSSTSGSFESTSTVNPWPTSNNYPGSKPSHDNGVTECQQEGFKPDEHDCRKFIRCVSNGGNSYQRYEFTCGDGTVWDQSIEACNHAWAVSRNNCGGMSNGVSNVGGGNEGSNEQSGYPGSLGETGDAEGTEEPESNEVPRPVGGYPQVTMMPSGPVSGYPQFPNQGYPSDSSGSSGPSYPSDTPQSQRPQGPPGAAYPPPSSGYPPLQPDERPVEKPSQQGSPPGSLYPPPYPGVPATQSENPSTSEFPESPGPTESPDEGSNASSRPPSGLYPPPANPSGEQSGGSGQGKPKPDASGSCKEEGFFPDPSDCKKFYRCVEGDGSYQKYEFTCGEGTAWDQGLLTCNHEYAVPGCGSSAGSERPAGTDTESTPSSSSNEVTSEPDGNQRPTSESVSMTSTEGTTTESSGTTDSSQPSSSSSEQTPEGTTEVAKQPEMTSESPTSVTTSSESSTSSESTSSESSSSESNPSESTPSSSDGSSTIPNTDEGKPDEVSTGSSPSKPSSGSCEAEGFFADPNDCHKFYRCVSFDHSSSSYTKFQFDCGPGTAWDQNLQTCNYEDQVESCEGSGGNKPSSEGPDESINEIESSSKPTESSEATTSSSSDTEGSPTPTATPESSEATTPTSAASTEPSEATTPTSAETEETSTPSPTTEDNSITGTTPSDITESTPDMSSEATTPSSSTEQSSTEEPKDTSTQPDAEGTTPSASSTTPEPESSSPGSESSPSTPTGTTSSQAPLGKFKCTEEGFFPNPSDCHKFIRCVKVNNGFIKYQFDCGPGTAWDQNLLTCNYEDQVESCEASGTSGSGTPTTQSSESTSSTETSSTERSETTEVNETTEPSTDSSTTPGDQTTHPEGTETTEETTAAETTTTGDGEGETTSPGGGEGETTPPGGEETTTAGAEETTTVGNTEMTTTEDTAGTETGEIDETETPDSTETVPPGSSTAPCIIGDLTDQQILLVCPTGFRRHPKHCNMFYQCTSETDMQIKILVLACPEGSIFDDKKVQCLAEEETEQKCMSPAMSSRFYRQLEEGPSSPVRVTRNTLCPDEGHYPYQEGCSNAFYKCKRDSRNSLQGYLYKCPKDFVYWSVSRRCERASRLPMCSHINYDYNERQRAWENSTNLPIEEFNISARSLKI